MKDVALSVCLRDQILQEKRRTREMEMRFVAVVQESLTKAHDRLDQSTQEIDVDSNVV